ncbi:Adrenodoxin, mitochondrial [Anabarilius grahami]|uniref:Adrenodoxin, mitochondrial n=1 Tax=Anabarilius grahami TaxID=495550 RepID=A0A3N0XHH6_ANAGA|nr:Adrenodoxin, mitochondrial [Anabarilius grahami]
MASRTCVQVLARSSLALVSHPGSTKPHPRFLHTVPKLCSQSQQNGSSGSKMLVHFVNQSGMKSSVFVTEGETLLDVVIKKNLDISGFGACEGTLACSTCHLIFEESVYDKLEPVVDEEIDMLDLAYGLTKTLDEKMFKPFSLLQWLDLHGSSRWPSAASMLSCVLSGACMYHAPMSVCVKRTECV